MGKLVKLSGRATNSTRVDACTPSRNVVAARTDATMRCGLGTAVSPHPPQAGMFYRPIAVKKCKMQNSTPENKTKVRKRAHLMHGHTGQVVRPQAELLRVCRVRPISQTRSLSVCLWCRRVRGSRPHALTFTACRSAVEVDPVILFTLHRCYLCV